MHPRAPRIAPRVRLPLRGGGATAPDAQFRVNGHVIGLRISGLMEDEGSDGRWFNGRRGEGPARRSYRPTVRQVEANVPHVQTDPAHAPPPPNQRQELRAPQCSCAKPKPKPKHIRTLLGSRRTCKSGARPGRMGCSARSKTLGGKPTPVSLSVSASDSASQNVFSSSCSIPRRNLQHKGDGFPHFSRFKRHIVCVVSVSP